MPRYRRRRYGRRSGRRSFRRRRNFRRRGYKRTRIRKLRNKFPIYPYKWFVTDLVTFTGNGALTFFADSYTFPLSILPTGYYQPYFDTFDFYRIKRIKVEIYRNPMGGSLETFTTAGGTDAPHIGFIYTFVDRNDATLPPNAAYFQQTPGCRVAPIQATHPRINKTYFRPTVLEDISNTIVGPKRSPWLSTTSDSIPHYGFKWGIEMSAPPANATVANFSVKFTYYVQFKSRTPQ